MTAVMIFIALQTKTPPWMWAVAMVCDTAMIITFRLAK